MFRLIAIILFISTTLALRAQVVEYEKRSIIGIVCDNDNSELLPEAVMLCNGKIYTPDYAGRLSGIFRIGDKVTFSHLGYNPATMIINDSIAGETMFAVFLSRDTIELPEIVVHPRTEILKELRTCNNLVISMNDEIAKRNISMCLTLAFSPYSYSEWDVYDNQRNTIQQNINTIEYRGMLAPNQTIEISNIAIASFISMINNNKRTKNGSKYHPNTIRPLSSHEMQILINENRQKLGKLNIATQKTSSKIEIDNQ